VEDRTIFQPRGGDNVGPGVRLNGVYEIESLIAQGGMGEVFKGFNIQTGDPVAIKMIRAELSRNPEALALFRREASILHNLVHDAIVRYFVFSVDPDLQRAYLAMEFVDGPSLAKRLAAGAMSLAEVRVLQTRIAGALDAAHKLGVVHRDISSDNVILQGGDVTRAKVIDFGIARSQRSGEGTIIGGGFAGKYNYVSPEQLGLGGGDVTYKSDIYSFGLVLAEAMRRGKAVVATAWSGNVDFLTPANSCPVAYRLVPARDPQGSYHHPDQCWAEPDIADAARQLRLLADPLRRAALGIRARQDAEQQFAAGRHAAALFGDAV